MAGKVLVGGTAYTIAGGRTCIGGTAYSINGGRTLVGGTAYSIAFKKYTFEDLLERMTVVDIVGREATTQSTVVMTITTNGTYYMLVFNMGRIGVHKVVQSGTITTSVIKQSSATYSQLRVVDSTRVQLSGTANVFGATMALVQFGNYTEAEIASLWQACTLVTVGSRDNKQPGVVSATANNLKGKIAGVATNTDFAFSHIPDDGTTPQVIFGTNTANPSLLFYDEYQSSPWRISLNGTAAAQVHGGSILAIS